MAHTRLHLTLALLLGGLVGCPPRLPPQPSVVQAAKAPPPVWQTVNPAASMPRAEVLLLTGGSRWDPPGQEGRALITALALAKDQPLSVGVGRDHGWVSVSCPPGAQTADACLQPLRGALATPLDTATTRQHARILLARAQPTQVLDEVLYGLIYEAHPYGHPTFGRSGVLDLEPAGPERPLWSRSTVRGRVVAPDAAMASALSDSLSELLETLPADPPPDAAMKAPPPGVGPVLARLRIDGAQARLRVGFALPRRPTATTRLLPSPDEVQVWTDLQSCLGAALPGWAWHPPVEAPDGWPSDLSTPTHPAAVWQAEGDAVAMQGLLDGLPAALAALAPAITQDCAEDPARAASLVRGALQSGYTVVVGSPDGIEDPWTPHVQDATLIDLPARPEDLFR